MGPWICAGLYPTRQAQCLLRLVGEDDDAGPSSLVSRHIRLYFSSLRFHIVTPIKLSCRFLPAVWHIDPTSPSPSSPLLFCLVNRLSYELSDSDGQRGTRNTCIRDVLRVIPSTVAENAQNYLSKGNSATTTLQASNTAMISSPSQSFPSPISLKPGVFFLTCHLAPRHPVEPRKIHYSS